MHQDPVIEATCLRLEREYAAHTILLYGSRADGTHTADSDYDIAAFAPIAEALRVTDLVGDCYLDVFVYPDSTLESYTDELLRLRNSHILRQRGDEADGFIKRLDSYFHAGPASLSANEAQVRRNWLMKMATRSRRGDTEGNFRRVWLLTSVLEDYFALRQRWYEGPKKALAWLSQHDPETHTLVTKALAPGASHEDIDKLVRHVAGPAGCAE